MDVIRNVDENSLFQRLVVKNRVAIGFLFGILFTLATLSNKLFLVSGLAKAALGFGPTPRSIAAGLPVVLAGEGLRTWSSGVIVKNRELTRVGPYSLTRNPLYLGSFILALGVTIMSGSLFLVIVVAILFPLIYGGVIRKEENYLYKAYGRSFLDYCERVPRFFPTFGTWPPEPWSYDIKRVIKKHKEWRAWLAVCAVVAYLVFCSLWMAPKP